MNRSRFQFSLRTLLLMVTCAAVAVAVYQWHTTRLVYLVEEHSRLVDNQEFSKAAEVADHAFRLYPRNDVARLLVKQSELLRRIQKGEDPTESPWMQCGEDHADFEWDSESKAAWDELSQSRR